MSGGVQNQQPANENTFNDAFMKENGDTGTTGKVQLNNADAVSGTAISNVQRELNAVWSFLGGIVNQVKTYLPTWTNNQGFTSTDTVRDRADALTAKLHNSTGHTHDNSPGSGGPIAATSMSGVVLTGRLVRATDLTSPSGSSMNVTTQMSGKTPSTGSSIKGVVVNNPYNEVVIRQLSNAGAGDLLKDAAGNEVYGRITESAGTWTLSFFVDLDGVETAYVLSGTQTTNGIRWWYQQLFNPITDAPTYSEMINTPSDNTTQDVVDAGPSQRGLITANAQTIGGKKTFNAGADMNSQNITNVLNPSGAQDAATKSYVDSALTSLSAFNKNKIINGDMRIDQRAEGTATTTGNPVFPVDRWGTYKANSAVLTAQRVTSSVPTGFTHALKFTVTTADAAVAAGDYEGFRQYIEGVHCDDLDFGKSTAKPVTISFWVRASKIGTYSGSLMNAAANRSRTFEYTISVADTWEFKNITIPGDTSGTWLTDTSIGLRLFLSFMAGSTFQQATGSWGTSGNAVATSNQVNLLDTVSATYYITGVKVETGSSATPFERMNFSDQLIQCERYYQKTYGAGVAPGTNTFAGARSCIGSSTAATGTFIGGGEFRTEMRAPPTVAIFSGAGTSGKLSTSQFDTDVGSGGAAINIGSKGFRYIGIVGASAGWVHTYHWAADAEM